MSNNPYHLPEGDEPSKPAGTGEAASGSAPRNPYEFDAKDADPFPDLFDRSQPYNAGPVPEVSPYEVPSYAPYEQQPAPKRGIFSTDFPFQKNIVPNPATKGLPAVNQKSTAVAYVLWVFFGWLGVHQFYLGNNARGVFHIALWAATGLLSIIGIPVGIVYFAYWVYDAVALAEQVREVNSGFLRKSVL